MTFLHSDDIYKFCDEPFLCLFAFENPKFHSRSKEVILRMNRKKKNINGVRISIGLVIDKSEFIIESAFPANVLIVFTNAPALGKTIPKKLNLFTISVSFPEYVHVSFLFKIPPSSKTTILVLSIL